MDKREAGAILENTLAALAGRSYEELVKMMGDVQATEVTGASGAEYTVEVEVRWDSPRDKMDLRVLASIDDGRLPGAFAPLSKSFIVAPGSNLAGA
jgi:hypothetical protein